MSEQRSFEEQAYAYLNGEFMPASEARISVMDQGFMRGYSLFDALSVWDGWVMRLDAHMGRFLHGLHASRFPVPFTRDELRRILLETVERSGMERVFLWVQVSLGVRADPTRHRGAQPTVLVLAMPWTSIVPPEKQAAGLRVRVSRVFNLPFTSVDPKVKNTNRLHSYLAQLDAHDAGDDETVMLGPSGHITEGRGANIFAVRRGELLTPGDNILLGITRAVVIDIARAQGRPLTIGPLTPYDLYTADEAFFATTAGGILPIVAVDGRVVGTGQPGEITRAIEAEYWRRHVTPPDGLNVHQALRELLAGAAR